MKLKKHTTFGKILGWLGFLFFISGLLFFNKSGVLAEDIPATIIGIILMLSSHFFKKKNV